MNFSRCEILSAGVGVTAPGYCPSVAVRAQTMRFKTDPFTLRIASGYPEPAAVALWTRLAPEPLVPGSGMPDVEDGRPGAVQ